MVEWALRARFRNARRSAFHVNHTKVGVKCDAVLTENSMRLWIGTSGYSYKEWKGTFYPEDLAEKAMLRFYAQHFATVEINNSFYRMPSQSVLSRWSEEVPDQFAFVLKAPRRITHEKRLENVCDDLSFLLKTASSLCTTMGPLLFPLPTFSNKDPSRLGACL